jgi:biopolymer transport protein ExbD
MRAQKVAFLKSDPEVDFQYVAEALDVMHRAGADRIGMMDADSSGKEDATAASLRR